MSSGTMAEGRLGKTGLTLALNSLGQSRAWLHHSSGAFPAVLSMPTLPPKLLSWPRSHAPRAVISLDHGFSYNLVSHAQHEMVKRCLSYNTSNCWWEHTWPQKTGMIRIRRSSGQPLVCDTRFLHGGKWLYGRKPLSWFLHMEQMVLWLLRSLPLQVQDPGAQEGGKRGTSWPASCGGNSSSGPSGAPAQETGRDCSHTGPAAPPGWQVSFQDWAYCQARKYFPNMMQGHQCNLEMVSRSTIINTALVPSCLKITVV